MTRDARRRTVITLAVWAIAGTLAVISPFLNFYSDGLGFSTTGFGRVRRTLGSNGVFYGGGPSGEHDLRLGIALCVAAALLLGAVALSIGRPGRGAALLGVVGAVALVFSALGVLLQAQSEVSGNDRHDHTSLHVGVWLALAAGALGIVGVVLGARDVLLAD